MLQNLYRVLKHTPGFNDDKEWKEIPTLQELADHLFGEALQIHGDSFVYKFDEDGQLVFWKFECPAKYDYTHCLPLEWIPGLELFIGMDLYSILIATLGLVADKFNLDVIRNNWNDMIIEDTDAYLTGEDDDDLLKLHVHSYKRGAANDFRERLRREAKGQSIESLRDRIGAVKAYNGELRKETRQWIYLGIKALENPINIERLFFPEALEYDEMDAINASDMYGYVWSFHDRVHMHQDGWYESASQGGCPVVGPMIKTEYFPNRMPKTSARVEQIAGLSEFMNFGRKIYATGYDKLLKEFYRSQESSDPTLLINKL